MVKSYIKDSVLPGLPEFMQPSLLEALDTDRLRSMPNATLPATSRNGKIPGLFLLGDALNMRHPMTGAGMTVALKDVLLLRDLLSPLASLADPTEVTQALAPLHWRRKRYSSGLNILAHCLYNLFASQGKYEIPSGWVSGSCLLKRRRAFTNSLVDQILYTMQLGFISYIQGGPNNFAGPAALMGGIVESPGLLLYYFFSIAIFSIRIHFASISFSRWPVAIWHCILVLWKAIKLITPPICHELEL